MCLLEPVVCVVVLLYAYTYSGHSAFQCNALSMYLSPNTVKFTTFKVSIRIFDVVVCFTLTPFAYNYNMYVWM